MTSMVHTGALHFHTGAQKLQHGFDSPNCLVTSMMTGMKRTPLSEQHNKKRHQYYNQYEIHMCPPTSLI